MKALILLVVINGSVAAQGLVRDFDPELKRYLELTEEQAGRILANNLESLQTEISQAERLRRLLVEAGTELALPSPDPMVVGSKYAERESICRLQADARKQTVERNRAVLTASQRQRLDALQESARLISVVREAGQANIYRFALPPNVVSIDPPGSLGSFAFDTGSATSARGCGAGTFYPGFPGNIVPGR